MTESAVTRKRIWRLAIPILISNASVPLLQAVDTGVVGHLGDVALIGGVALGSVVFSYVYASFNFLRMGTTGPTAQAAGSANAGIADEQSGGWGEVRFVLARALALALLIGVAIVLFRTAIVTLGLSLLGGSEAVNAAAFDYLSIRLLSAPAALALFAVIGWFWGMEDARVPLLLQVGSNLINMSLDLLFVFKFGWGIEGVAAATVIAEYAALAAGLFFIRQRLQRLPPGIGRTRFFEPSRIRRMVAVNRDIFIRTVCLVTGFAVFMSLSARIGDLALAANQVLYHFMQISAYALDGFAHAAEALVGEAYGAGDRERVRRTVRIALRAAGLVSLAFVAFWFVAGPSVIDLLTSIEPVRARARALMPFAALMPLFAVWAYTLDGIFLGATQNTTIRNAMLASLALYLAAVATVPAALGTAGLWVGLILFLSFRAGTLGLGWPRLLATMPDTRAPSRP